MILQGKLAKIMVRIDPSMYQKYVTYSKNGIHMLYVCLS